MGKTLHARKIFAIPFYLSIIPRRRRVFESRPSRHEIGRIVPIGGSLCIGSFFAVIIVHAYPNAARNVLTLIDRRTSPMRWYFCCACSEPKYVVDSKIIYL